jgi:hypothetical protein
MEPSDIAIVMNRSSTGSLGNRLENSISLCVGNGFDADSGSPCTARSEPFESGYSSPSRNDLFETPRLIEPRNALTSRMLANWFATA